MLALRPVTQAKLEHGARALVREFADLPREVVVYEVESVTRRLLEHARFDDYIPLLVYRFARERLCDHHAWPALPEAA